jgi:hypothetical protein
MITQEELDAAQRHIEEADQPWHEVESGDSDGKTDRPIPGDFLVITEYRKVPGGRLYRTTYFDADGKRPCVNATSMCFVPSNL